MTPRYFRLKHALFPCLPRGFTNTTSDDRLEWSPGNNPYTILNITSDSNDNDIKIAYFKLVKSVHPDINKDNSSRDLELVNQAYSVLKNPEKKEILDRQLKKQTIEKKFERNEEGAWGYNSEPNVNGRVSYSPHFFHSERGKYSKSGSTNYRQNNYYSAPPQEDGNLSNQKKLLLMNYSVYGGILVLIVYFLWYFDLLKTKDDFEEITDNVSGSKYYLNKKKLIEREEEMKMKYIERMNKKRIEDNQIDNDRDRNE